MNGQTRRIGVKLAIAICLVSGCPGVLPVTIVSDVPCISPEWSEPFFYAFRNERMDGGRLLFTSQTQQQFTEDIRDNGVADHVPHDVVYAYEMDAQSLEVVDAQVWDTAVTPVRMPSGRESSEEFIILGVGRSQLVFQGNEIPVTGGTAVGVFTPLGGGPIVAVLSATGPRTAPFLTEANASGQHYHQLFSEETGRAVGVAIRLGFGNGRDPVGVGAAWSTDSRFVVYQSGGKFCIADGLIQ